jgi:hypothetical protein
MKIISVSFSAMPDDFVMSDGTISQPAALIIRRKDDGTTVLTVNEGSDDEHNRGFYGLKGALKDMTVTTFLALQQQVFAAQGLDMADVINAGMGVAQESSEDKN